MMMRLFVLVLATFATSCGLGWHLAQGHAQEPPTSAGQRSWPQSQANFPHYGRWWDGGYRGHASTAEEGLMRGRAALMEADGARNLMNSQALGFIEDARRKNIDNRIFKTDAYFEMRRINREARAAAIGPRATAADLERYARLRAPRRLNSRELHPGSGAIAWPAIFREAEYAENREMLDRFSRQRATTGYLTGKEHADALQALEGMDADLKKNVRTYAPQDYMALKSFLGGLRYELVAPAASNSGLLSMTHH
jgi:hypothetical protein